MSNLYSFITEFRGGTYIAQIAASDLRNACFAWAESTARAGEIEHLDSEVFLKNFRERVDELPPSPIDGCPNVWLFSLWLGRHGLDVHIVKTSNLPENQAIAGQGSRPGPAVGAVQAAAV